MKPGAPSGSHVTNQHTPSWTWTDNIQSNDPSAVCDAVAPSGFLEDHMEPEEPTIAVCDAVAPSWTHMEREEPTIAVCDAVAPSWIHMKPEEPTIAVCDAVAPSWTHMEPEEPTIAVCDAVAPSWTHMEPEEPTIAVCDAVAPSWTHMDNNLKEPMDENISVCDGEGSPRTYMNESEVKECEPNVSCGAVDPIERRMSVGLFRTVDGSVLNPDRKNESKSQKSYLSDDDTIKSEDNLAPDNESMMQNKRKGTKIGEDSRSTCTCGTSRSFRGSTHSVDCTAHTLHSVCHSIVCCESQGSSGSGRRHRNKNSLEVWG